jgi:hypothetical protein
MEHLPQAFFNKRNTRTMSQQELLHSAKKNYLGWRIFRSGEHVELGPKRARAELPHLHPIKIG